MQPEILLRDSLTQVYSRSALNSRLPEEVNRAMRYGQTFSIVLLDIDYFKVSTMRLVTSEEMKS